MAWTPEDLGTPATKQFYATKLSDASDLAAKGNYAEADKALNEAEALYKYLPGGGKTRWEVVLRQRADLARHVASSHQTRRVFEGSRSMALIATTPASPVIQTLASQAVVADQLPTHAAGRDDSILTGRFDLHGDNRLDLQRCASIEPCASRPHRDAFRADESRAGRSPSRCTPVKMRPSTARNAVATSCRP